MGEYVGIDPQGCRSLVTQMSGINQQLTLLKPSLIRDIQSATADFPQDGANVRCLDSCWQFLADSQRDLSWRIGVITRDGNARSLESGRILVGSLLFDSYSVANRTGQRDGGKLNAAWKAYQTDPSLDNEKALQAAINAAKTNAKDAEYANGLLGVLGKKSYLAIVRKWMERNASDGWGLNNKQLDRAKRELGPLAELFAAVDGNTDIPGHGYKDGRDWHKYLLNNATASELSTLISLAHQTRRFVVGAGTVILKTSGTSHTDWNTYRLVQELDRDPKALQYLLVEGDNAQYLLRPSVARGVGIPGFPDLLAHALDGALNPQAGEPPVRAQAWKRTIATLGHKSAWGSVNGTPLTPVLAKHVGQYFPELSDIQANSQYPDTGAFQPRGSWRGLKPEVVATFFGGLMQDGRALPILRRDYEKYIKSLDMGSSNPYGSSDERRRFFHQSRRSGGLASLLLGGLHSADLSAEEKADFASQIALLPVDLVLGALTGETGLLVSTAAGKLADIYLKGPLQDVIQNIIGGQISPGDVSKEAERLAKIQITVLEQSIKAHHGPPMTPEDKSRLEDEFKGSMEKIIRSALQERNG